MEKAQRFEVIDSLELWFGYLLAMNLGNLLDFLRNKLLILGILDLQKFCEHSTEFPYTPHLISCIINILH